MTRFRTPISAMLAGALANCPTGESAATLDAPRLNPALSSEDVADTIRLAIASLERAAADAEMAVTEEDMARLWRWRELRVTHGSLDLKAIGAEEALSLLHLRAAGYMGQAAQGFDITPRGYDMLAAWSAELRAKAST